MDAGRTAARLEHRRPDLLDVVGYNYVDRWRDRPELDYEPDRIQFPNRRFVGTESSSIAGVRGDYASLFAAPATRPVAARPYEKLPLVNMLGGTRRSRRLGARI